MFKHALLALASVVAFAQITPIPGGGGGGGGCVAGAGIACTGSTISVDTAVIQSRATAQSGESTKCVSATGSAAMTCALTPTLTAYEANMCLVLNSNFANVTTATLDVDALGVKSVLNRSGAALAAGDIPLNKPVGICYDGTQWIVQGGTGATGATVDGPGLTISGNYYVYNRRMTPIVTSNWTSYNLNAETVRTNGTGYISLDVWGNTRSYQMVCTTLPASPYRIRVHFLRLNGMRAGDNPNEMGVALRNSSDGKFVLNYIYLYSQWIGGRWASFSSEASQYWNNTGSYDSQPIHSIDIQDDGTNRIWRFWDGFRTYRNFQSTSTEQQLRTEYTTPDQVCFGASGQNGNYRFSATLVGYDVNPTW